MDCQNCILGVQRHFFLNFFHKIIIIGPVSEKIQLVLSKLHSTFRGTFEQNNSQSRRFGFFSNLCQIFEARVAKTVFYVPRGTFGGFFFHRIILNDTVSENNLLVLSELHSTFLRNFWAKKFSFSSPCQILQAWVVKSVFYVSRDTFCGTFLTESYYLALWAKKFSWFCQNCILLFRGPFEQNNSRSRRFGFFSSPRQILQAWVAKTVFYVSKGTFCGFFFHRIILIDTVSEKKFAGFVRTTFYFSAELLSKKNVVF